MHVKADMKMARNIKTRQPGSLKADNSARATFTGSQAENDSV